LKASISAVLILVGLLFAASSARCQIAERDLPKNEFGLYAGWSPDSPHVIGTTSHRQIGDLGLRYGRMLIDRESISLEYIADVVPFEMVLQPKITNEIFTTPPPMTTFVEGHREYVYGGGVNPIGFKLNFFRQHRLQFFVASEAGFVASTRRVPIDVPGGTQFNFTFDFQGGIQRVNSDRSRAWMLGYKLQHISNAGRSALNPGVDGNVFFVGYSFFR
jgi:hypothetical protein